MSDAAERLDSHETRISNLEAERGDHSRKLIEHEGRFVALDRAVKHVSDGVSKSLETANRALRTAEEAREEGRVLERAVMRAVDKAVSGMAEHLKKQDAVLEEQNRMLARLVKKADNDEIIAASDEARGERIVWWAKAIVAVAAAVAIVGAAIKFLVLKG